MTDLTDNPEVVCLCGSTRFKVQYRAENRRLTMAGKIVLSVGLFGHADGHEFTDEEKDMLDALHKRKIDLADRIHVINVDGYIGDSTQSEIDYARETGTEITYLEQPVATDGGTTLTLPSDALERVRESMPDDALSTETETRIDEICATLDTHQYASGCSPRALASAAVYAAALALNDTYNSDYTISQRTVAEWGGVSRGSIRTHYKAVMAVWAEENADQLTADQRRAYSDHWGAEIDVPKRAIRTDGGTDARQVEWEKNKSFELGHISQLEDVAEELRERSGEIYAQADRRREIQKAKQLKELAREFEERAKNRREQWEEKFKEPPQSDADTGGDGQ